jgi:hypothetical protein
MPIRRKLDHLRAQVRTFDWKGLPARFKAQALQMKAGVPALWSRLLGQAKQILPFLRQLPARIQIFILSLGKTENGALRRMTLLRGAAIAFAAVCILGGQNPFGMLVPVLGVDMPVRDSRETIKVMGYSSQANGLVTFERRIQWSATPEENVERIAHLLVDTSAIRERAAQIDTLPDYGYAIRKVWRWQNDTCIVDLRSQTLTEEADTFLRNRNKDEVKPRASYLDAYFMGLTQSVLAALPACKSVQYLLDGKREGIKDMKFDLTQTHSRQS